MGKIFFILTIFFFENICFADDSTVNVSDLNGYVDMAVPESPAFVAIGVTPENVIRPGTGQELIVNILDSLDRSGHLQSGTAVEFSPYMLTSGDHLTLNNYRSSGWLGRSLYNLKVSFARTSGESDGDKSNKTALGFRWSPINDSDKRMDAKLSDCFSKSLPLPPLPANIQIGGDGVASGSDGANKDSEAKWKACMDESNDRQNAKNNQALDVGYAFFKVENEGVNKNGWSLWSSYSYNIKSKTQLTLHVRKYSNSQSVDINNDKVIDSGDGELIGVRLRFDEKNML